MIAVTRWEVAADLLVVVGLACWFGFLSSWVTNKIRSRWRWH